MSMPSPFIPAYAKLNLTLAVLGKRPDGYHDLASIFQSISLHDALRITPTHEGTLTLSVDDAALQTPKNLALRAAELLRTTVGDASLGVRIELCKAIPVQGGLGGGSSDAALVLMALTQLWHAGLFDADLHVLAARLGSDVPFFITGGTARIGGRGEAVTLLPDLPTMWFVLAKPPISISTADIFRRLTPREYGSVTQTDALEDALRHQRPLPLDQLTNTLEPVACATYPEIQATRDALMVAGAPLVRMSGSGPTLYAPFIARAEAEAVYTRARANNLTVWLCSTVSRERYRKDILGGLSAATG